MSFIKNGSVLLLHRYDYCLHAVFFIDLLCNILQIRPINSSIDTDSNVPSDCIIDVYKKKSEML